MNKAMIRSIPKLLSLTFVVIICAAGCGIIKKRFDKPLPEEVVHESSSVRLIGYEQTVTVNATPEEFVAFMSEPSRLMPSWIRIGKVPLEEDGLPRMGTCVPFTVKMLGFEIKGRLIVVKSDLENIWFVWDNQDMFQILRWKYKPTKGGIKLTFQILSQIPKGGIFPQLEEFLEFAKNTAFRDLDMVVARVQAHFDPSLDPEELVGVGFRGEDYYGFFQVTEARVLVDASPGKIKDWVTEAGNIQLILEEFNVEEDFYLRFQEAPKDKVLYTPAIFKSGVIRSKADLFFVKKEMGKGHILRFYIMAFGNLGYIDLQMTPEKRGSILTAKVFVEIPASASTGMVDQMLLLAGIPKLLQEKVLLIRNGVEGEG